MVKTKEVKKRLKQSCPTLPDLVESDIKSDGKNSLCEEPQFESGGDEVEIEERAMWADHPVKQMDSEFEFEVKAAPHQAPEEVPVVDPFSDQGCSVDGKS